MLYINPLQYGLLPGRDLYYILYQMEDLMIGAFSTQSPNRVSSH
jgi:hypothetical protein